VAALLGARVPVAIGLISYSAYLWHQPLFAFALHRSLGEPQAWVFALLAAASLALAWLSWRFIETPFRRRDVIGRRTVVRLALGGSVVLVVFGVLGHATDGRFWRDHTPAEAQRLEERLDTNFGLRRGCSGRAERASGCDTVGDPDLMLWGDSFAMHLFQGLQASWSGRGIAQYTSSECAPILGQAPIGRGASRADALECLAHNAGAIDRLAQGGITHVALSASFARHIGEAEVLLADGTTVPGREVAFDHFVATLQRIRALGVTPVVFSHPPADGRDIGRCLVAATLADEPADACDLSLGRARARDDVANAFLERVAAHAPVVWLHEGMCGKGRCPAAVDGVLMYRDAAHLSREGSARLGRVMDFGTRILAAPSP
jgi:hypothetical protein